MNSPKLAQWALSALLPREIRDAAIGDLEEGFAKSDSPRWWYWTQVAKSAGPALSRNSRKTDSLRAAKSAEFLIRLAPPAAAFALLTDPLAISRCAENWSAAFASYLVVAMIVMALIPVGERFLPPFSDRFWLFQITFDMIAGIIGGALIARLVPMAPVRAARFLAVALGVLIAVSGGKSYGLVPLWYHAAFTLAGPFCVLFGASISSRLRPSRNA